MLKERYMCRIGGDV